MAKIYGREADVDKVRADEDALREAMKQFVSLHRFTERDKFTLQSKVPAQTNQASVDNSEIKQDKPAQAA